MLMCDPDAEVASCVLKASSPSLLSSSPFSHTRSPFTLLFVFKRVVPKGLDHTLSVITVSLYVCYVCVCNVVLTGGGGGTTLVPKWSVMITDHFEPMWFHPPPQAEPRWTRRRKIHAD